MRRIAILLVVSSMVLSACSGWRDSRASFNKKLINLDEETVSQGWQRHYMRGEKVTGDKAEDHQTKRRLKKPVDV